MLEGARDMSANNILNLVQRAKEFDVSKVLTIDSEGKPRKQSDVLLDIGKRHELFHADDGVPFARMGNAVYAVESTAYREVLAACYLDLTDKGCNRNSLADAITTLSSLAKHRGNRMPVWLRVGYNRNNIVIDMGRADWRMIEVGDAGWQWCDAPPMFRRTQAMHELPEPKAPEFSRLWKYVNVAVEHRPLVAAYLLAALRPSGPYPILFFCGEQGTGKSTTTRVLRRLVDPSASLLRAPPKDVRDLLVGALNGWVLTLDNLTFLGPQLSDTLCRLATGGAISERALYTNLDEVLVEVKRPVIVNGIEDLATRPDLAERGLHVELELIENRRPEADFWSEFEADAPHIFGALLEGLAQAIRTHRDLKITKLPRMADFAKWACAGIGSLGFTADEFLASYKENLDSGTSAGLDSSPVGGALLVLFRNRTGGWSGTATELLDVLGNIVGESVTRSPAWPRSGRGMGGAVKRLAPALRLQGISVVKDRDTGANRDKLIHLCRRAEQQSEQSKPSNATKDSDYPDCLDGHPVGLHDTEEGEL